MTHSFAKINIIKSTFIINGSCFNKNWEKNPECKQVSFKYRYTQISIYIWCCSLSMICTILLLNLSRLPLKQLQQLTNKLLHSHIRVIISTVLDRKAKSMSWLNLIYIIAGVREIWNKTEHHFLICLLFYMCMCNFSYYVFWFFFYIPFCVFLNSIDFVLIDFYIFLLWHILIQP